MVLVYIFKRIIKLNGEMGIRYKLLFLFFVISLSNKSLIFDKLKYSIY